MRVLLGAFGDPGHTFPIVALGRALQARGHEVVVQTWRRWEDQVEAEGLQFAAAPEYDVFPTLGRWLKPYEAAVLATRDTAPLLDSFAPDVVVSDILTLAPALAAELAGVPSATLIPHVDPRPDSGFPPYSIGARVPRTELGRRLWRSIDRVVSRGLEQGRVELNDTRVRLGLPELGHVHGGISRQLSMVATLPQLEYPRSAELPGRHVIGPLQWEPEAQDVELPPGDSPLVLVAPSTSQDPGHRLLRAALAGLADLPVRVLATWNGRAPDPPVEVPVNARLVEWLSYSRTMPLCDIVVCHGGHGTVMRALTSGCVVVAVPAAGDMNENAARIDWAGCGVRVPRIATTPRALRLAVGRALGEPGLAARARELAAWSSSHDAAGHAAGLVEQLAGIRPPDVSGAASR